MDTETAFWEMVHEIGSSREEFKELDIGIRVRDGAPIVDVWAVKLEMGKPKNPKEGKTDYNVAVMFNKPEIDLRDPDSFKKLAKFIEQARAQGSNALEQLKILDMLDAHSIPIVEWSNDADV